MSDSNHDKGNHNSAERQSCKRAFFELYGEQPTWQLGASRLATEARECLLKSGYVSPFPPQGIVSPNALTINLVF